MAKRVFKAGEVAFKPKKVFIQPPIIEREEEVEEIPTAEEYAGPTAEDLRKEAEAFKQGWEAEKKTLTERARAEADRIVKEAEAVAFEEVKRKNNQAQKIRQAAEDEAQRLLAEAKEKAAKMQAEVERTVGQAEKEAYSKGHAAGHEAGYEEGKAEAKRLIERLHVIISKAIDKRNEILAETETQVINLVLLIVKKVIKVISENQKNVVINNVVQALRKLKSRGDVVIRVNLSDLELTTEHVKDFMGMVEQVKSITVLEDSTVDRGGCVIETDFGQIDARISSQLHEIEEKIIEMMPIRSKGEG
jgi:flagellar assembly protein FliH